MSTPKNKTNYKADAEIRAMTTFNVRAKAEEENAEETETAVEPVAAEIDPDPEIADILATD